MHTTPLPPPPAPPEPPRVLTLQETCWKVIRRHTNTSNVLELLQFFEKVSASAAAASYVATFDFDCAVST